MTEKPTYEELEQKVKEFEIKSASIKQMEKTLAESEERQRQIIDNSNAGYFFIDLEGRFQRVNSAWLRLHKYEDSEEIIGQQFSLTQVEDELENAQKNVKKLFSGEEIVTGEFSRKCKDGSIGYHTFSARPVQKEGKLIGLEGFLIDITDRKRAEESFEKESHLRTTLLDNIPGCIALILKKGTREIVASNRFARELGAFPGETCFKTCGARDDNCPFCLAPALWETGQSQRIEVEYRGKWYEGIWAPLSEDLYVHYIFDITERKRSEDTLRESRNMLRTVLDSIPSAVFWKNRDLGYGGGNRTWLTAVGLNSSDEVVGKNDYDLPWDKEQADSFREDDRKVMDSGIPEYDIIEPYRKADGTPAWAKTNKVPLRDAEGNILGVLGTYEDITERKQAEETLLKQQYFLQKAQEIGHIGTWELDIKKNELLWTDENYRIFGIPIGTKLTYETFLQCVHPDDREYVDTQWKAAFDKKPYDIEHCLLVDGKVKWVREKAELEFNEKDECIRGTGFTQDITKRKRAEEALRKSEENYRCLVENQTDLIARFKPDGTFVYVNQAYCQFFEKTKEELIGNKWQPLPVDDDVEYIQAELQKITPSNPEVSIENRVRSGKGRIHWIQFVNVGFFDPQKILVEIQSVGRDITDRRQAEQALREQRDFAETLLDAAQAIVLVLDTEGRIVRVNSFMEDLTGYRIDEVEGKDWFSTFLPEEDHDRIRELFKQSVADIQTRGNINPIVTKDGREVFIEWYDKTLKGPNGTIIGVLTVGLDITERRRAEEGLRESEEKFKNLFDNASDAIFIRDKEGNFLEVNQVACDQLGYNREELLEMTPTDLDTPEYAQKVSERTKQILEGPVVFETVHVTKDGRLIPVEMSSRTIDYLGQHVIMTIARDISERKEAEEEKKKLVIQLRQAQKMEAIGTLAGGVAHDFNNILSPIMIQAELVKLALSQDHPLQENLEEILNAACRAKDLVKHILAFSRQEKQKSLSFDMRTAVGEVLELIRSTIPSSIQIIQQIPDAPATILGDPTRIHEVVMNLCTNAAHAMDEMGSILQVELRDVELDEETAKELSHDLRPGDYVRFTVSDTGHGIPSGIIEKIFDPYFTTKEIGKGTGMGLSVVHGIVKEHGGAITVYSEPEQGTTFHVFFPKAEGEILQKSQEAKVFPKGTERILFVDDEKAIVRAGSQMLEQLGYRVHSTTSSLEALEIFSKDPNGYDLVVTDMTMPNMTGDVLAREMMRIRPDIPMILCTGFSYRIDEQKARSMGIKGWIMKPFILKETAEKIREVLDKERG